MLMRLCATLIALIGLFDGSPAKSGVLLVGELNGVPLKMEMGLDRSRVLATAGEVVHLIDLEKNHVYRTDAQGTVRHRAGGLDDGASTLAYSLSDWSAGPPVAGHGSRYNVLQVGEEICGEVLASAWMSEFMGEITRSLELVQRVDQRLRPISRDTCGAIPLEAFTSNGWPLMAGWKDETVFHTQTLRFDYRLDAKHFILPQNWVE